jgi:glutamyl-tRNA synthetase
MPAATPGGLPRGRYAPSPTGDQHLGNASTALLAWLSVRSRGGAFVIRMEDLDRPRVRPGSAERILDDLAWLGLDWDEGPDVGGPHEPYEQSRRTASYEEAFARLRSSGLVYPCFCSRRDIATAASAPQEPGDEILYPGTCRALDAEVAARRIAARHPHAWRFRVEGNEVLRFHDLVRGACRGEAPGDFVVRRADGAFAYQLAVVVDDAAMGITEVVRGDDLLASTARQLLLYRALGLEPPAFAHVPLLLGPDGVRLSKRHAGTSIRALRDAGRSADSIVGRLASLLGLRAAPDPVRAADLVAGFSLRALPPAPGGIRIETGSDITAVTSRNE